MAVARYYNHDQNEWVLLAAGRDGASGASSWNELTGKPATFPPSAHTHTIGQVEGLQSADGKIREDHLPDRLSESALDEKIMSLINGALELDPDPDPEPDNPYSFAIRADTAPVNDRKQTYALTAEEWAALSYLRDQTASNADPLGALNVALRSDAAEIISVTSVTARALVEDGGTDLGKVRTVWLRNPSPAYNTFLSDIGPVIDEISTKGVLI